MEKLKNLGRNFGISALVALKIMSVSGCDLGEEQPLPTPEPQVIETPQPTPTPTPTPEPEPTPTPRPLGPGGRDEPVIIEGDEQFVRRIEDALAIVRRFPEFYEVVSTHIGIIRHSGDRGTHVVPMVRGLPRVYIGDSCLNVSTMWVAGGLVHEAYNSKLFNEYVNETGNIPPSYVWERPDGEVIVLGRERDFFVTAGAPQRYIQHVEHWIRVYQEEAMERQAEAGN